MTREDLSPGAVTISREGPSGLVSARVGLESASLESLRVGGVALIQEFSSSSPRPFSAGVTLAPWPNRVRDGRWNHEGQSHQLEITEPGNHNAIHGLVARTLFGITSAAKDSVEMETRIAGHPGYPFDLSLSVIYRLVDDGIECEYRVINRGSGIAPVALGAHPFVCLGNFDIRTLTIQAPVAERIVTDERLLPTGSEPLSGGPGDLRQPTSLADLELDTGFRVDRTSDFTTRLTSATGESVELWQGEGFGWLQLFTTDDFPGESGRVSAIAIEPMSAPADALNSGTDLWWLEPGANRSARWGIRLR